MEGGERTYVTLRMQRKADAVIRVYDEARFTCLGFSNHMARLVHLVFSKHRLAHDF